MTSLCQILRYSVYCWQIQHRSDDIFTQFLERFCIHSYLHPLSGSLFLLWHWVPVTLVLEAAVIRLELDKMGMSMGNNGCRGWADKLKSLISLTYKQILLWLVSVYFFFVCLLGKAERRSLLLMSLQKKNSVFRQLCSFNFQLLNSVVWGHFPCRK